MGCPSPAAEKAGGTSTAHKTPIRAEPSLSSIPATTVDTEEGLLVENKGILDLLISQLTEFCNASNTKTQLTSANLPSVCSHPVCKHSAVVPLRRPGKHPPSKHPVLSEHSSLLKSLETIRSFPRQGPQGQAFMSPGTSAGSEGSSSSPLCQRGSRCHGGTTRPW